MSNCPPDCDRPKIATVFIGNRPVKSCFVHAKSVAKWPGVELQEVRGGDPDAARAFIGRLVEVRT